MCTDLNIHKKDKVTSLLMIVVRATLVMVTSVTWHLGFDPSFRENIPSCNLYLHRAPYKDEIHSHSRSSLKYPGILFIQNCSKFKQHSQFCRVIKSMVSWYVWYKGRFQNCRKIVKIYPSRLKEMMQN